MFDKNEGGMTFKSILNHFYTHFQNEEKNMFCKFGLVLKIHISHTMTLFGVIRHPCTTNIIIIVIIVIIVV